VELVFSFSQHRTVDYKIWFEGLCTTLFIQPFVMIQNLEIERRLFLKKRLISKCLLFMLILSFIFFRSVW
jgi:hypothetical protein